MKRIILTPFFVLAGLLCAEMSVLSLGISNPSSACVDAAFTHLFGEIKAFSAEGTIRVFDRGEQEIVSTVMDFALGNACIRMEVDISNLKSKDLPAGVAASLEQLGMARVISLILPDKKSSFLIYPGLKAMLKMPMKEELKAASRDIKLTREAIGTENLDGYRCIKYRVTITDGDGKQKQALTWNATDLREFPLRLQIPDGDNIVIMCFRNVKLVAPDPRLFNLPIGYAEYDSQQGLMQAVMVKALNELERD